MKQQMEERKSLLLFSSEATEERLLTSRGAT